MKAKIIISDPFEYAGWIIDGSIIKIFNEQTLIFKANNTYNFDNVNSQYFLIETRHKNENFLNNQSNISIGGAIISCNYEDCFSKAFLLKKSIYCFTGSIKADFSNVNFEDIKKEEDIRDYFVEYSKNLITAKEMGANEYYSINNINNSKLKEFVKEKLFQETNLTDCKGLFFDKNSQLSQKFLGNYELIKYIEQQKNKNTSDLQTTLEIITDKIHFSNLGDGFIYKIISQNNNLLLMIVEIVNKYENPFFCIIQVKYSM